jgi:HPt (histidine-containing phosphotransfer) domain-containing protein
VTERDKTLRAVRTDLLRELEVLEERFATLPLTNIVSKVDQIRAQAEAHDLGALADLAHGLETQLSKGSKSPILMPWVSALKEAALCDTLNRTQAQAWTVVLRRAA